MHVFATYKPPKKELFQPTSCLDKEKLRNNGRDGRGIKASARVSGISCQRRIERERELCVLREIYTKKKKR